MTASFNLKEVTWQTSNSVFGAFIHLFICLNFRRLWSSFEVSSWINDLGKAICFATAHKKLNKVNVRGSKGNVITSGLKKADANPLQSLAGAPPCARVKISPQELWFLCQQNHSFPWKQYIYHKKLLESFKQAKVLNTADTVKKYLCAWEIMFNVT